MTKYHFIDFLHVGEGRLIDRSGQNCTQTIDKKTIGEPAAKYVNNAPDNGTIESFVWGRTKLSCIVVAC